jgi:methylmalonyl-CoA mutase
MAIENDVHVVGVSSLAAGHKYLVPEVRRELDEQGSKEIYVVVGGIIPPKDYDLLLASGAAAIFGPGTPVIESANKVLNILEAL